MLTTLAMLGTKKNTGRIFLHTLVYTLLTTFVAATMGALDASVYGDRTEWIKKADAALAPYNQ